MDINELGAYVFLLAAFLGLELIRRVSPLLHTPLMSLTNAISAISVVGAIVITGQEAATLLSRVLGFIAVTAATINLVSGYLITDRMLNVHPRSEVDERAIKCQTRRSGRRDGHAACGHRHVAPK